MPDKLGSLLPPVPAIHDRTGSTDKFPPERPFERIPITEDESITVGGMPIESMDPEAVNAWLADQAKTVHLTYDTAEAAKVREIPAPAPVMLTTLQAADVTGLGKSTINKMAQEGVIPGAVKSGRSWQIPSSSLPAMVAAKKPRPRSSPADRAFAPEAEEGSTIAGQGLAELLRLTLDGPVVLDDATLAAITAWKRATLHLRSLVVR